MLTSITVRAFRGLCTILSLVPVSLALKALLRAGVSRVGLAFVEAVVLEQAFGYKLICLSNGSELE